MSELASSFSRALLYCLRPQVIWLSLLPLLVTSLLAALLGYLFWNNAVASISALLDGWSLVQTALTWMEALGLQGAHTVMAPLVVLAMALPLLVVFCLLLVSAFMTPAIVRLVAQRRFPHLECRRGGSVWQSVVYSGTCTVLALLALLLSLPLWLVPPFVLILPPLIWGWLTYRVISFDVLAEHASSGERRQLMRQYHWPLLGIGVACGYMGAAPALVWTAGVATVALAPLLVVVSIWLYTFVFAFSALWFAHYLLAALDRLRAQASPPASTPLPGHAGLPTP